MGSEMCIRDRVLLRAGHLILLLNRGPTLRPHHHVNAGCGPSAGRGIDFEKAQGVADLRTDRRSLGNGGGSNGRHGRSPWPYLLAGKPNPGFPQGVADLRDQGRHPLYPGPQTVSGALTRTPPDGRPGGTSPTDDDHRTMNPKETRTCSTVVSMATASAHHVSQNPNITRTCTSRNRQRGPRFEPGGNNHATRSSKTAQTRNYAAAIGGRAHEMPGAACEGEI